MRLSAKVTCSHTHKYLLVEVDLCANNLIKNKITQDADLQTIRIVSPNPVSHTLVLFTPAIIWESHVTTEKSAENRTRQSSFFQDSQVFKQECSQRCFVQHKFTKEQHVTSQRPLDYSRILLAFIALGKRRH